MFISTFRIIMHAQLETVWDVLLDRIENPQTYQPLVQESKVTERSMDGLVREMKVQGMIIRERMTLDQKENAIYSEVLEHPRYTGTTITRLVPTSAQNPMAPLHLEIHLKLELKPDHLAGSLKPEEELTDELNQEMVRIKNKAEERED